MAEQILLDNFPEVEHVVSKIGTAEVPTDPMAIEDADIMIILKDKDDWTSADNREDLMALMKDKLAPITWASFEFTQPIQLRFNELMTGAKSDISVKIFGESPEILQAQAALAAGLIEQVPGAGDVKVDQTDGLRQLNVKYDRNRMAQFGINVREANQLVRAAYAGEIVGSVYEEERKFDLVVRLADNFRGALDLTQLTVRAADGHLIPLSEVAMVEDRESPMLISREQARRFINIGINVRNRDVAGLVAEIQQQLGQELDLPAGYEIQYGGQFENLQSARQRLLIAVPIALGLILLLLYLAFSSFRDALVIFVAVPLAAIGGVLALLLRGMPFSISSGIGFIALFGIAVLNGIVLISAIRQLLPTSTLPFRQLIMEAATTRLRPVLMTAAVAAFGFLPMAFSTGSGAEVQRPLATVVIGGLLSSTLLTLVVLPALYYLVNRKRVLGAGAGAMGSLLIAMFTCSGLNGQQINDFSDLYTYALAKNPTIQNQQLAVQVAEFERSAIGQWAPLEITYQGGQINTGAFDHNLSIQQDLTHLLGKQQQNDLVDARKAALGTQAALAANTLGYRLATTYTSWRHELAKQAVLDSMLSLYQSVSEKLVVRQRAGTLGAVDEELFRRKIRRIARQRALASTARLNAEVQLRALALLPDSLYLRPRPLLEAPAPLQEAEETLPQEQAFRARQNLLVQEQASLAAQSQRPNISAGYFLQTLENDFAFQGLYLGVGIPLDRRASKAKAAQLQVKADQLNQEVTANRRQRQIRLSSLRDRLQAGSVLLATFDDDARQSAQRIFQIASLQLQQGAIDFLTFNQLIESQYEEQLDRLEQVFQLHLLHQELRFLTNTY